MMVFYCVVWVKAGEDMDSSVLFIALRVNDTTVQG